MARRRFIRGRATDEWRERDGKEKVTDEGRQKVDLHTMLPLLYEYDTLICYRYTLVCEYATTVI